MNIHDWWWHSSCQMLVQSAWRNEIQVGQSAPSFLISFNLSRRQSERACFVPLVPLAVSQGCRTDIHSENPPDMQISCQTTGNQSIFFFFIFVHSNFNIYFRISIIEKSISGKGWFINMNHYSWEIFHSIFPRIMVKYSITIDIHLSPMKTDATHGNIFLASDLHQK